MGISMTRKPSRTLGVKCTVTVIPRLNMANHELIDRANEVIDHLFALDRGRDGAQDERVGSGEAGTGRYSDRVGFGKDVDSLCGF